VSWTVNRPPATANFGPEAEELTHPALLPRQVGARHICCIIHHSILPSVTSRYDYYHGYGNRSSYIDNHGFDTVPRGADGPEKLYGVGSPA